MGLKQVLRGAALSSAAAAVAVAVSASPALASTNDSFSIKTSNGCGTLNFVDYGPGAPGGGNNDDYMVIHDYCSDGHGVRAWAFVKPAGSTQYQSLGSKYNGNGLAGAPVYWDPFKAFDPINNLIGGDTLAVRVCLVNGSNGKPLPGCSPLTYHKMADG